MNSFHRPLVLCTVSAFCSYSFESVVLDFGKPSHCLYAAQTPPTLEKQLKTFSFRQGFE